MPTGSGKSLCYHLPGAMQENKITIVFEPLLSLMKNQLDYLRSLKIAAETINSQTTTGDRSRVIGDLKAKQTNTKFLYITPEQAATTFFKELLSTLVKFRKVAFIAGKFPQFSKKLKSAQTFLHFSRRGSLRVSVGS